MGVSRSGRWPEQEVGLCLEWPQRQGAQALRMAAHCCLCPPPGPGITGPPPTIRTRHHWAPAHHQDPASLGRRPPSGPGITGSPPTIRSWYHWIPAHHQDPASLGPCSPLGPGISIIASVTTARGCTPEQDPPRHMAAANQRSLRHKRNMKGRPQTEHQKQKPQEKHSNDHFCLLL